MSDFDISESKDEELVLLIPQHFVLYHKQSDADALTITKLAKKICRKRWPKAYIKIFNGQNYCLEKEEFSNFILIGYDSRVGNDVDMESWASCGAIIRTEVEDKIVAQAMASAGKVPSDALRKRISGRRAKPKKRNASPSKEKPMTIKERTRIVEQQKARWASLMKKGK